MIQTLNFAQLSIVSQFVVAGTKEDAPENALVLDKTAIVVEKADGEKCERCWTYSETVGQMKNIQHYVRVVRKLWKNITYSF